MCSTSGPGSPARPPAGRRTSRPIRPTRCRPQPSGGSWSILQGYGTSATATWNTSGSAGGTYLFDVWVRQTGSTVDWESHISPNPTYTLQAPVVCTAVTWNAPSPASPQAPGTQVTLSATASGCPDPVYQFWVLPPGGSWTLVQAYSPSSTATWSTTGLPAGTYQFDAWAKQSGSSASWEAHVSPNPTYTLQTGAACTGVTWNAPSPASPQAPGAQVTLSGTAAGCPNPQYQFYILPPGGSWTILQAYGSSASAVWNTGGAATGTYQFDIWVRQNGSTAQYEAHVTPSPTYTLQTCTGVTVTFAPASPQHPGTSIQLNAAATGCANAQYEFWIQAPGGQWTVLQGYGSASSFTWNTTGLATGTYLFDVWVRQNGSSAQYEAHISPNPTYTLS